MPEVMNTTTAVPGSLNLPMNQSPAGATALGGIVPGAPPPATGGLPTDPSQMSEPMRALIAMLQQAQRPRLAPSAPVVPGGSQQPFQPQQVPSGRGWGPERMMNQIGAAAQTFIQAKQQREIAHAENQYTTLLTALDKYVTPDGKIDPRATDDRSVMAILGNPKELSKISKALHVDWLNPKPTTAYQQGMANAIANRQKKQQAREGVDRMVHWFTNRLRQPQPNLTPDQQRQMASQVTGRAPISGTQIDLKDATSVLQQMNKLKENDRDAYLYHDQDKNGNVVGVFQRSDGSVYSKPLGYQAGAKPRTPSEPHTVTTGDGVFQFNDKTGRYDIRIGSAPREKTDDSGKVKPMTFAERAGIERGKNAELRKAETEFTSRQAGGIDKNGAIVQPMTAQQLRDRKQQIQNDYEAQLKAGGVNVKHFEYPQPGGGNSRTAPPASGAGDTVTVISPQGVPGTIPRANLQKALQRGYKLAPQNSAPNRRPTLPAQSSSGVVAVPGGM